MGTNVTLKNLILMNANVKDEGGAIYNSGKRLFTYNINFINNVASNGTI